MFDIGFAELLLIAIIGLLVIGPQRLPETIRTLALWIGRLRRGVTRAYREIEKEVGMDDIRRQLHNEEIMRHLNDRPPPKPASQASPPDTADSGADSEVPDGKPPARADNDGDTPR